MAAGSGERFGGPKQFFSFGPVTVAEKSCSLFRNINGVERVIAVYPSNMTEQQVRREGAFSPGTDLVKGGVLREESVEKGLDAVKTPYVLIHDAARPLCPREVIIRVIEEMKQSGAAVPGINPDSSVRYEKPAESVCLDRNRVFLLQTPQGYRTEDIVKAYKTKKKSGYTDSSAVAEEAGIKVKIVDGDKGNIKITARGDYENIIKRTGG